MTDTKDKAIGQFKLRVTGTLGVFDTYGMGVHIPEVANVILTQALELHKRLTDIHLKEARNE